MLLSLNIQRQNMIQNNFTYRLFQIPLTSNIIQRQSYSCLVQPNLSHDVIEKLHDRNPSIRVRLQQLCKHSRAKKRSEKKVQCSQQTRALVSVEAARLSTQFPISWKTRSRKTDVSVPVPYLKNIHVLRRGEREGGSKQRGVGGPSSCSVDANNDDTAWWLR